MVEFAPVLIVFKTHSNLLLFSARYYTRVKLTFWKFILLIHFFILHFPPNFSFLSECYFTYLFVCKVTNNKQHIFFFVLIILFIFWVILLSLHSIPFSDIHFIWLATKQNVFWNIFFFRFYILYIFNFDYIMWLFISQLFKHFYWN